MKDKIVITIPVTNFIIGSRIKSKIVSINEKPFFKMTIIIIIKKGRMSS